MFEVIAEIEPPVSADLTTVSRQVTALRPVASRFLVPDNHTGRATVSSLVVAGRIARLGAAAIACLNARDRNLLGLRRDLLTAQHLGIDEALLVYGDEPTVGERAGTLTVRTMLDECSAAGLRPGVTTRLTPLPAWKQSAGRLFVQVSWSIDELLRWRDRTPFAGEIYAGVMVLPSRATAERIGARIPGLRAPGRLLDALERDGDAGVHWAVELVEAVRDSGAFSGVHLIAGRRYAQTAACLGHRTAARHPVGMTMEKSA